jgi:hypothetical protein
VTAVAPAGSAGSVDVTVTTAAGTSATSAADTFFYVAPSAPTVTGLGTTSGPTGGGTNVTINGTNLALATQVLFGTLPATSFTVTSATSLTAIDPAETAGNVDVTVVTPYGTSAASSADVFTFTGTAPTVTALDQTELPDAGGSVVTLTGTNFNDATAVAFAGTAALAFSVIDSTTLMAIAPAGAAGSGYVTITNSTSTSSTGTGNDFTYVDAPAVTALGTTSGPTGGGTSVTLSLAPPSQGPAPCGSATCRPRASP